MYQNACKKCGSINLFTKQNNTSIGLYCSDCGAWIKWLGKNELRAFEHSESQKVKISQNECEFDYGVVTYKRRFSLNKTLDDYKEVTLKRCIRIGIQYKYNTKDNKPFAEVQLIYKDDNNDVQCLCENLYDYSFSIKHKGNMQIDL